MPETVLVVDDDAEVLEVVASILRAASFTVLTAKSGPAAINVAAEHQEVIDVLLTDVEMSEMSGPALGQQLKMSRRDLQVILMAGSGSGNLLVFTYAWAYIPKPLVAQRLVQMVNNVLHSENRSQLGGQELDTRKDQADHRDIQAIASRKPTTRAYTVRERYAASRN